MNRETTIERFMKNPRVTVLIVGAGINGIGTFRDLALQGVDVLLVDKDDYCSGASAASSHMVHGGIRYLENGEFRLVREAVVERNRLIENAPHLVKPLPTVFPIFKIFSGLLNAPLKFFGLLNRPSERGALVIKMGMSVYDMYTRDQETVPPHVFHGRKKSLKRFPKLNPKVLFTGTYYDGAMPSPERIAIEVLRDALDSSPKAWAANYVRATRVEEDRVYLVDEINGESFFVEPDLVINATGPWIDFTNLDLGEKTNFIGGTKGSHLVLHHPELRRAIDGHEFFFENKDGRIVLIYPLEDKVMIGTSDIQVEDPENVVCTDEEIDYFFEMVGRVFPAIKLERSHTVYQFSGVRPLPQTDSDNPGQISRDHQVDVLPPGQVGKFPVYSLVGGKWTSFRAFSEHVTDMALDYLDRERITGTQNLKIGGSDGLPTDPLDLNDYKMSIISNFGTSPTLVDRLVARYGTLAEEILAEPAMVSPTGYWTLEGYTPEEIAYLAKSEDILHLDDLLLRRSMIGKLGMLDYDILIEIAEVVARVKGWSDDYKKDEIVHTLHTFEDQHGIRLRPTVIG